MVLSRVLGVNWQNIENAMINFNSQHGEENGQSDEPGGGIDEAKRLIVESPTTLFLFVFFILIFFSPQIMTK